MHNKGCYHKRQYNVMFFCIKGLIIQTKSTWQPLLPSAKGRSFTFQYLLLCKESKFFSLFLFIFLLWQASCGEERSRHIYVVGYEWAWVIIVDITPEVNTLGGETKSPYLCQPKIPHQVEILLVHPKTLKHKSCFDNPPYLPKD